MKLPTRPACFGQSGLIQCNCDRKPNKYACTASRQFWEACWALKDFKTNEQRSRYLAVTETHYGKDMAALMRKGTMQLIRESSAQGDLLGAV